VTTGIVSTVAGNGDIGHENSLKPKEAMFSAPSGILIWGPIVYVADRDNHAIRTVNVNTGVVDTLAGGGVEGQPGKSGYKDGAAREARFASPAGVAAIGSCLYIADADNHCIRAIDLHSQTVSTLSGTKEAGSRDGNLDEARFNYPAGLMALPKNQGQKLVVADRLNQRLRLIDLETKEVTTIAGCGEQDFADGETKKQLQQVNDGEIAMMDCPIGLCMAMNGKNILFTDMFNHRVRELNVKKRAVTTVSGGAGGKPAH